MFLNKTSKRGTNLSTNKSLDGKLNQDTLVRIGFTANNIKECIKIGTTVMDLAGAIAVIEAARDPETIDATAAAMSNAFKRSDVLKTGIRQHDLMPDDSKLLSMVTTPVAYEVLSRPSMLLQIQFILTTKNVLVNRWKSKFTYYRSGGESPIGPNRAFWVNVGNSHGGKNHIPTYTDKSGIIQPITSKITGGCLVIGGLCFRDSYKATPVEVP